MRELRYASAATDHGGGHTYRHANGYSNGDRHTHNFRRCHPDRVSKPDAYKHGNGDCDGGSTHRDTQRFFPLFVAANHRYADRSPRDRHGRQ